MYVNINTSGRSVFLRVAPFLMLMGINSVCQYSSGKGKDILISYDSYKGELFGDMQKDIEISLPVKVPTSCYPYDYYLVEMYNEGNYDIAILYIDDWGKTPVLLWYKNKNVILATDIFNNSRCATLATAAITALLDAVLDIMPPKIKYFEVGDKIVGLDGNIYDSVEKYEEKLIREIRRSTGRVMAAIKRASGKKWEVT